MTSPALCTTFRTSLECLFLRLGVLSSNRRNKYEESHCFRSQGPHSTRFFAPEGRQVASRHSGWAEVYHGECLRTPEILQKIEADIDRENPEIDYDYPNKWFDILEENKRAIESVISKLGPADAKNALRTLKEGERDIINTGYKHAWSFLYALDADDEVEMEMTPFEDQRDIDRAMKEVENYKSKAEKMFKSFQSSISKR